jgi:hypothetical protein
MESDYCLCKNSKYSVVLQLMYTHRVSRFGIFRGRSFQFELVEAAHVCYIGDGDMFKMEDVGDEKANS